MSVFTRISYTIGVILTVLGCFLPWQRQGDFVSYWSWGFRIYPSIKDNGGFLILLFCIILAVLIFLHPSFIKRPREWAVGVGIVLVLTSVFHIGRWMIAHSNASGIVGAPAIQIGLIMVLIGSVLLFLTAMLHYRKVLH